VELVALADGAPERDRSEELSAYRLLYETSRQLVAATDVESVLLRVLDATVALLHADKGFVELRDRADGRLRVIGHRGYGLGLTARLPRLRVGGGHVLEAGVRRARSIVPDASVDPSTVAERPLVEEAGVRGLQSTPLYAGDGALIGIVSSQYAEPRPPREADLWFLDSLLEHAARFVERLWREDDLQERERRSEALLERFMPAARAPAAKANRRVLVVDDNEDAANMLGELLEDAGHEVRTAYSGMEALRAAHTFLPDVVLLDIGLPDMDGYDVARRLRASRAGGAKIAALTGWAQPHSADESEAAGIDVHLVKPASLQAIEDVIGSVEPRDPGGPFDPSQGAPDADPARRATATSRRVMVIDDDDDIRESLIDFLDEHGFQTVGARDGVEALDQLGRLDPPPCLIILDLMMPKMDGRTFRQVQLEREPLANIPVVVISAYRDVEENARDLQAANWLPKPLNLPALLQVVRAACADA
jgi:CheY-like chemotaxis protein